MAVPFKEACTLIAVKAAIVRIGAYVTSHKMERVVLSKDMLDLLAYTYPDEYTTAVKQTIEANAYQISNDAFAKYMRQLMGKQPASPRMDRLTVPQYQKIDCHC